MLVYHRFETLSAADSGKQHCFTWTTDKGEPVLRAMYQSGADAVPLTGGNTAPRGKVLRLQTDADAPTAPGHGIAIQLDAEGWQEEQYLKAMNALRHDYGLTPPQQIAAMSQTASLLNLMATRFGDVFTGHDAVPLRAPEAETPPAWRERMDAFVTHARLKAASAWFAANASALMEGKTETVPPPLPFAAEKDETMLPVLWMEHSVEPQEGRKRHLFSFRKGAQVLTGAVYFSGQTGERIGIKQYALKPFPNALIRGNTPRPNAERFDTKLGGEPVIIPVEAGEDMMLLPGTVLPAEMNAYKLKDAIDHGEIVGEQRVSALLMLASLYRLIATRYNGEFGYKWDGEPYPAAWADSSGNTLAMDIVGGERCQHPLPVQDAQTLARFIEDRECTREADRCIELAAQYMMKQEPPLERLGKLLAGKAFIGQHL